MRAHRLSLIALSLSLPLAACQINEITGVDPDEPSNLAYQLIPSGDPNVPVGILLTWDPPSNGRAATFDVFGRASAQGAWARRATTTSPSFYDLGVPELQYYVLARDDQGNSLGQTDIITVDDANRLPAPQGLASISLDGAIQLTWSGNAVSANPSLFDYYRVYSAVYDASHNGCSQWALEGSTVSDGFLSANLTNGVSLCFAVSAVSKDGHESARSAIRQDTPRFAARNVLVYSHDVRTDSSGFYFYDESTRKYGLVTAAGKTALDFTVERHSDGTLWFSPARSDVLMAVYGSAPVADLTSIDRAQVSSLASVTIEAVPGYGYVFSTKKSDGMHYAALRVAYVAQNYVVFDWSYQSGIGNPELSRTP